MLTDHSFFLLRLKLGSLALQNKPEVLKNLSVILDSELDFKSQVAFLI